LNVQELAGKIDLLWNEPHQRELLRGSGIERAAAFSWAKTARETLAIYRSMVEKSR